MNRKPLKRNESRTLPTETILAQRDGRLFCRDCGEPCKRKAALKAGRRQPRCPACGGLLDRRAVGPDGQPLPGE
jgi:hypothetical protein